MNDIKGIRVEDVPKECAFCVLTKIETEDVIYIICTNDGTILDVNLNSDFAAKNNEGEIDSLRLVKKHSCDNGTIIIKKDYGKKNFDLNINYSERMYDKINICSKCKKNICLEAGYVCFYSGDIYNLINEEQINYGEYNLNIYLH